MKMAVGIFVNFYEFPITPSLKELSLDFMENIENCIHTNENFLGILNNSKNFKVIVNLGTLAYF